MSAQQLTASAPRPLTNVLRVGGIPRAKFVLAATLSAAAVLAGAALLGTSGYLISKAALQPPILTLTVAIVGVRAFGVARAVLRYSERIVTHDIALGSLARLRSRFFAKLIPLIPGGVAERDASGADLLSSFVADVESLRDLYVRVIVPPPAALLASVAVVGACLIALPPAAAALCAGVLLSATLSPAISAWIARSGARRQAGSRAELTAEIVDAIDGGAELAANGAEHRHANRTAAAGDDLAQLQRRDAYASAGAALLTTLIGGLTVVAVLALAVDGAASGELAGVAIAVLLFLSMGVFEAINPLSAAAQSAEHCRAAASRVTNIIDSPPVVVEREWSKPIPASGSLDIEDVSFAYSSGQPDLLVGATLKLRQGERVALVGPSGSGKSTIANLLVRFIDPSSGVVRLGGVDLRELDADELREVVRLEGQAGFLFTTSIRENLKIGRPGASDAELIEALRRVGLGEWFDGLKDGLGTLVGEQGELVSGGQRQRIAFARGLLARSRFLILDEPTAQLDQANAAAMIDAIVDDTPPSTAVLVITHDDNHLHRFDRVIRLTSGHLVSNP